MQVVAVSREAVTTTIIINVTTTVTRNKRNNSSSFPLLARCHFLIACQLMVLSNRCHSCRRCFNSNNRIQDVEPGEEIGTTITIGLTTTTTETSTMGTLTGDAEDSIIAGPMALAVIQVANAVILSQATCGMQRISTAWVARTMAVNDGVG